MGDYKGKQAMGLTEGPTSAKTVDACRQACCDKGSSCEIYQFSEHPSRSPNCWIGKSSSSVSDPSGNYQSRSRVDPDAPKPYHLKVMMSRYIFASIDNFSIQKATSKPDTYFV